MNKARTLPPRVASALAKLGADLKDARRRRRMPMAHAAEHGVQLHFPRDHGAHPATLTEWWYITGWLRDAAGAALGMQITFFRNHPRVQEDNPSAFAPQQLLFAHAALVAPQSSTRRVNQRRMKPPLRRLNLKFDTDD